MNICYKSTSYDLEGQTIQEVLCQFISKINENVNLVNSQEERVQYLLNQGVELEVAKKIDDMYQKGILETIIAKKLPYVKYYKNVESMKADRGLKDGMTCITQGYYEPNDGGGAEYLKSEGQLVLVPKDGVINIKLLGAKGDGITDDTEVMRKAFNFPVYNGKRTIIIPEGTYLINPALKIPVQSNTRIEFTKNAKFICKKTDNPITSMFEIVNVENVEIINPILVGDRLDNTSIEEGAGHCISCRGVKNLRIINPKISNAFTDGIYLNNITNGYVENVKIDNCRRQGISVISCDGLIIKGGTINNSNGKPPQMGIDIEPNGADEILKNLVIEDIVTQNNKASGIGVNLTHLNNSNNPVSITIKNCVDYGSDVGFSACKYSKNTSDKGFIDVIDFKSYNSLHAGILINGYKADGNAKLRLIRPIVVNPNTSNDSLDRVHSVGISIVADSSGTAVDNMGNIDIINPMVKSGVNPIKTGIFLGYGKPIKNVRLIDPIEINIGQEESLSNKVLKLQIGIATEGYLKIYDKYKALTLNAGTNRTYQNYESCVYSNIIAENGGFFDRFTKWDLTNEITLYSKSGTTDITLPTRSGISFYNETGASVGGNTLTINGEGGIIFRKVADKKFQILKQIGTYSTR